MHQSICDTVNYRIPEVIIYINYLWYSFLHKVFHPVELNDHPKNQKINEV
jgi:hypothetical protein